MLVSKYLLFLKNTSKKYIILKKEKVIFYVYFYYFFQFNKYNFENIYVCVKDSFSNKNRIKRNYLYFFYRY